MISNILLGMGIVLVGISYLIIFVSYLSYRGKRYDDMSGFDSAKEVTFNYDDINIVESSDVIFSEYLVLRNVIRLNKKNYDGNSYFDIAVGVMLAGYSLVSADKKNYFKFIKRMGYLGFVSLIGVILSCFFNSIGDAKIGVVVVGVLLVYQYMRYQINVLAVECIKENLKKDIYDNIVNILNSFVNFSKISFIVLLLLLMRFFVIIFGF